MLWRTIRVNWVDILRASKLLDWLNNPSSALLRDHVRSQFSFSLVESEGTLITLLSWESSDWVLLMDLVPSRSMFLGEWPSRLPKMPSNLDIAWPNICNTQRVVTATASPPPWFLPTLPDALSSRSIIRRLWAGAMRCLRTLASSIPLFCNLAGPIGCSRTVPYAALRWLSAVGKGPEVAWRRRRALMLYEPFAIALALRQPIRPKSVELLAAVDAEASLRRIVRSHFGTTNDQARWANVQIGLAAFDGRLETWQNFLSWVVPVPPEWRPITPGAFERVLRLVELTEPHWQFIEAVADYVQQRALGRQRKQTARHQHGRGGKAIGTTAGAATPSDPLRISLDNLLPIWRASIARDVRAALPEPVARRAGGRLRQSPRMQPITWTASDVTFWVRGVETLLCDGGNDPTPSDLVAFHERVLVAFARVSCSSRQELIQEIIDIQKRNPDDLNAYLDVCAVITNSVLTADTTIEFSEDGFITWPLDEMTLSGEFAGTTVKVEQVVTHSLRARVANLFDNCFDTMYRIILRDRAVVYYLQYLDEGVDVDLLVEYRFIGAKEGARAALEFVQAEHPYRMPFSALDEAVLEAFDKAIERSVANTDLAKRLKAWASAKVAAEVEISKLCKDRTATKLWRIRDAGTAISAALGLAP